MIKSRNAQFTHYQPYQEAKRRYKKLKNFNFLLLPHWLLKSMTSSSDTTSEEVIFLTSRQAHVNHIIISTFRAILHHQLIQCEVLENLNFNSFLKNASFGLNRLLNRDTAALLHSHYFNVFAILPPPVNLACL